MTCSASEDPGQVLKNINIDFIPPSYADFTKSQNDSGGLPFPRVKYDELISKIQFSLIDDRAKVIAQQTKTENYSPKDFGAVQLKNIAKTLGKMFWLKDKKIEHLMIQKVKSIMKTHGK